MAKQPISGKTKTRLSPPLTHQQAAHLYACFLLDTLAVVRSVRHVQPVVVFTPSSAEDYFARIAPDFELSLQVGPDLSSRLDHAFSLYLGYGYRQVVIINSDSPTLPSWHLVEAFQKLDGEEDLVLGPSMDGGYYLIGLKQPAPRLLRDVRMSTPTVAADTLALAAELGLKSALLPEWYDIDRMEDLYYLITELRRAPEGVATNTRAFLAQLSGSPSLAISAKNLNPSR